MVGEDVGKGTMIQGRTNFGWLCRLSLHVCLSAVVAFVVVLNASTSTCVHSSTPHQCHVTFVLFCADEGDQELYECLPEEN